MDRDDEYRRQAAEAQSWADRTVSHSDKAAWLRIAQGWLSLVRRPTPTPTPTAEETFDVDADAQGISQASSVKSN
jgi:hypothetical protein